MASRRAARKAHFAAPAHVRRVIMSARLSKEQAEKYGRATLPIHAGDSVRIVTGAHKKVEGKVARICRRNFAIYVEDVKAPTPKANKDGKDTLVAIHPSNVVITGVYAEKGRKAILERKSN